MLRLKGNRLNQVCEIHHEKYRPLGGDLKLHLITLIGGSL